MFIVSYNKIKIQSLKTVCVVCIKLCQRVNSRQHAISVSRLSKLVLYHQDNIRELFSYFILILCITGFHFHEQFPDYHLPYHQSRRHRLHAIRSFETLSQKALLFGDWRINLKQVPPPPPLQIYCHGESRKFVLSHPPPRLDVIIKQSKKKTKKLVTTGKFRLTLYFSLPAAISHRQIGYRLLNW